MKMPWKNNIDYENIGSSTVMTNQKALRYFNMQLEALYRCRKQTAQRRAFEKAKAVLEICVELEKQYGENMEYIIVPRSSEWNIEGVNVQEVIDLIIEYNKKGIDIKLALEKQIPKKPYLDNENGLYEKEYCPTCHRSLFPNEHHCECGQAIDWSEE